MTQRKTDLKVYKRLLKALAQHSGLFALGIFATLVNSGISALLAYLIKPIIDRGFIAREAEFIKMLPIILILIFVIRGFSGLVSTYAISRVGRSIVMDFRQKIFAKLLTLPSKFFDKQSGGEFLSTILYNVEQLTEATTFALVTLAREGFLAIGLTFVMFYINWKLSLLMLIAAPLIYLLIQYTSRRMRKLSTNIQATMASVTHIAEEGIEGNRVIRSFGSQAYEQDKFNKATSVQRNRELKIVITNAIGTAGVQIVTSIPIAITIYLATMPKFHISAGSFAAILAAMLSLLRPLRRITRVNSMIQKGIAGAESIFKILDSESEKDTGTLVKSRVKGDIVFNQVNFAYDSQHKKAVLNEVSFQVQAGETVAIVGQSGAGKTTLVNLLPRFYEPLQGEILIDGVNIQSFKLSNLREQFAFVSQNITLFNDTVRNNICYGKFTGVSDEALARAIKMAHADEFIQALPQGLNTLVGKDGILLSGGQRQRLAIARALLKNAPILILDEATSALDTESERHIQAALETLMVNRTTLIIAHRLSTIEAAAKIIVLKAGRVVERGNHADLIALKGVYAKLHAMQFKDNLLVESG